MQPGSSRPEVALFHHALGLTDGIERFAEQLRDAGHVVHTPDLFEGRTFSSIEEGVAYAFEEIGITVILERATRAVAQLPEALVYAGFSLGVVSAQMLAQTRAGARGALLYYSCVPPEEFGRWPDGLPAQIHAMDQDPLFINEGDLDAAQSLVSDHGAELFLYPGTQHYFADSTLPSFDPHATTQLLERSLELLRRV